MLNNYYETHADFHIGQTLILPDDHLSYPQYSEEFPNLIVPQQQNSLPSEHERTGNIQEEDTNLNKSEIFQPPDYAIDTSSQLPAFSTPTTEYFQFSTLSDPCIEDKDKVDTSAITSQTELLR